MRCPDFLKTTLLGLCLAISIIQIGIAIKKVMNKPTMTSFETTSLKTLDCSISISVCKNTQLDLARAQSIGYKLPFHSFSGNIGLGNNSGKMLSWTGAYGNMTFNETLHYLYPSVTTQVEFELMKGTTDIRFLPNHGFCNVFHTYPNKYLRIRFNDCDKSDSFLVTVYDPASVNSFQLARMTGGRIMHECKHGIFHDYHVQLAKAEDRSGGDACVEYPTRNHKTYTDCVDDEMVSKTKPVFGYGLPFVSNSTGEPIQRLPEHESTVEWLETLAYLSIGGVMYQADSCLPPCTMLTASTELQQSTSTHDVKYSVIYLICDGKVDVKTSLVAYGLESLLVEIGSCLGLWLGLSVIGVCHMAITWCQVGATQFKSH